jgi:hypothetical protein
MYVCVYVRVCVCTYACMCMYECKYVSVSITCMHMRCAHHGIPTCLIVPAVPYLSCSQQSVLEQTAVHSRRAYMSIPVVSPCMADRVLFASQSGVKSCQHACQLSRPHRRWFFAACMRGCCKLSLRGGLSPAGAKHLHMLACTTYTLQSQLISTYS